jgi:DNA-binding MarR family transcriptional regulator
VRHAEVVVAMYDVAGAARRLSRADPIDTGAVRLLAQVADNGPCRLSELAGHAGLDLSTVSRHARELVDQGYLLRSGDPDDKRAVLMSVSETGLALLADVFDARVAAVAPVLDHWTDDDRAQLAHLLRRLADDLTAAQEAQDPA